MEKAPNSVIEDIPCVLGAGYACRKTYWQYLNGLSGLMFYGCDEEYISLKVWLSGGKCRLLKSVVIGHIYRPEAPYKLDTTYMLYNRLLIADLLLPNHLKKKAFAQFEENSKIQFDKAYSLFKENEQEITRLKQHFQSIATSNFDTIYQWNIEIFKKEHASGLKTIADNLMLRTGSISDLGLLHGKIGIAIFFAHYAQYTENKWYDEFAGILLDGIYKEITKDISLHFKSGLCGIGWSIEYLLQSGFMEGDSNEILGDIDMRIMEWNPKRIRDHSLEHGVTGLLHYAYARLLSSHTNKAAKPFDQDYLDSLAEVASAVISGENESKCAEISQQFISLLRGEEEPEKLALDKVARMDGTIYTNNLGLKHGSAGLGLEKMAII